MHCLEIVQELLNVVYNEACSDRCIDIKSHKNLSRQFILFIEIKQHCCDKNIQRKISDI